MKMRESDMASGNINRSDNNNHSSNISSFSQSHNKVESQKKSSERHSFPTRGEKVNLLVGEKPLPLTGSKPHSLSGKIKISYSPVTVPNSGITNGEEEG